MRAPFGDIKTPEGRRIYKAALERSGRIQIEREKHKKGGKEWKRLTDLDVRSVEEARTKALALNPKHKPAPRAGCKGPGHGPPQGWRLVLPAAASLQARPPHSEFSDFHCCSISLV
jgi:hypothetical protein